ncbi:hypothetical protein ACU4GI_18595 [Cupriavidus basilensis]
MALFGNRPKEAIRSQFRSVGPRRPLFMSADVGYDNIHTKDNSGMQGLWLSEPDAVIVLGCDAQTHRARAWVGISGVAFERILVTQMPLAEKV